MGTCGEEEEDEEERERKKERDGEKNTNQKPSTLSEIVQQRHRALQTITSEEPQQYME